eukprot:m.44415 g.44415  ORF g.44415 m.44415 type:complete len:281 (-) comp13010_c0_seq1:9-851(-)
MAFNPIYTIKAAMASVPLTTRSLCVMLATLYVACKLYSPLLRLFCLNPQHVLVYGQVHRLVTYSLLHKDAPHLLLSLVNWSLIAPTIEAALGTFSFAWLLGIISVLNGCVYTLLTIGAAMLSDDAEYHWHNCAIGFSGTVLSVMVIWVYTFASSSRIQLGPAVELPLTVLPPVLFLVSLTLPSASVWCHLTGLVVGMLYVAGALDWPQLSREASERLEKSPWLRLAVTRQGFVSANTEVLPTTEDGDTETPVKSRRTSSQAVLDVPANDSAAMKNTIQLH